LDPWDLIAVLSIAISEPVELRSVALLEARKKPEEEEKLDLTPGNNI
jgi:hypothetical protein